MRDKMLPIVFRKVSMKQSSDGPRMEVRRCEAVCAHYGRLVFYR